MVPSFASRRVLEIGCGSGRLTERYAHEAGSVIAIDPDADGIAELTAALPGVDARAVGIGDLILPAHSVDIVLFAWSL
jgi:16S rRNA A1518/A1519 N6-dimethyltransferase RsmA/KsgA/DIM1 with predicted DNA glycosylase/AP lyase activity